MPRKLTDAEQARIYNLPPVEELPDHAGWDEPDADRFPMPPVTIGIFVALIVVGAYVLLMSGVIG